MEQTLKFKKGKTFSYEAKAVIDGRDYLFAVDGSSGIWCLNVYINNCLTFSDGWKGCTKRMWAGIASDDYRALLGGGDPYAF
jgi:hypothetical protein